MRSRPLHAQAAQVDRRTSLVVVAVFVTLLALPGVYQLLYGFRGGELSRWRTWLRDEPQTSDALRRVDDDLAARFFLATTIRNWRADAAVAGHTRLTTPNVVDGPTEYLFVDADAQVPRAVGLLNRRLDKPTQAITALADLHARLRERGIHLLVVPIPPKASIYPDKLERGYDLSLGPDLNVEHAAWFAALRATGVNAIDLADAFWAERARERADPSAATFTRGDSHWTWHGVAIAADAIRDRAEPFLAGVPRRVGLRQNLVSRVRDHDLVKASEAPLPIEREERAFLLDATGHVVTGDDSSAPIVLLGDSFAAGFNGEGGGLAQAIEFATGVPTHSAAEYGGSVASMRRALANPAVMNGQVRVVVFAFAMRHLITSDWPLVPVNVAR